MSEIGKGPEKNASLLFQQMGQMPEEVGDILMAPITHWDETVKWAGVSSVLVATDWATTDFIQDEFYPLTQADWVPKKIWPNINGGWVAQYMTLSVGAMYGVGWILQDSSIQFSAILTGKAMAYSYFITHLSLKSIIGRKRPYIDLDFPRKREVHTGNPLAFGHVHNPEPGATSFATAMPSFHFTMIFSAAKVWHRLYDSPWIPYSIAALLLVPNFDTHRHWTSDMFVGAVLGTMIGNKIVDHSLGLEERSSEPSWDISPMVTHSMIGMTATMTY